MIIEIFDNLDEEDMSSIGNMCRQILLLHILINILRDLLRMDE